MKSTELISDKDKSKEFDQSKKTTIEGAVKISGATMILMIELSY
jgi:hypothetical protein